ncbi:MAG TPA: hypothetical protein VIL20_10720 [Sandaracinaceae bacterium]
MIRELPRVANEKTEEEWNRAATGRSAREVERMVAQHAPGDLPTDPPRPERTRKLVLDVSAPTWALFEEARRTVTAELGEHVSDDALVATLARAVLQGAQGRNEGRASYTIALTMCESCKATTQHANGEEVAVGEARRDKALCDARRRGRTDAPDAPRATQTVPPTIRRAVLQRHESRCAVPGCRHAAFLDVHHVERRADGGTHDPERLLPLCGAHHDAVHEGTLVIRGTWSRGFVFEHADGRPYGTPSVSPARAQAFASALQALVALGFEPSEAQPMLDRARAHVGAEPTVEEVIRTALRLAPCPALRRPSAVREELATYVRLAA